MYIILTFFCALGFSLLHFFSKQMAFAGRVPRSKFLSLAAGVSVSYIFVHLLPELNKYQKVVSEELRNTVLGYVEHHIYLVAMAGLILFYALEKKAKMGRNQKKPTNAPEKVSSVFWVHIALFFIYNTIIGYLLLNQHFDQVSSLLFYFLALAVHFIANDWSLRRHHEKVYDQYGRLLLSFASLFGWILALFIEVGDFGVSVMFAFVAGGMILNIMKEELPEEQQSSISSFVAGAGVYTILLLLV